MHLMPFSVIGVAIAADHSSRQPFLAILSSDKLRPGLNSTLPTHPADRDNPGLRRAISAFHIPEKTHDANSFARDPLVVPKCLQMRTGKRYLLRRTCSNLAEARACLELLATPYLSNEERCSCEFSKISQF